MPSDSNVLNNISEPTERRQAERRAARLAVVSQVIHQINATHDPDAIARLAAALLHQRLGFSHTFILWADEVAQELILVATQGVAGLIPTEYRQKVTLGIVGRAARTRQAQLVNDIRLDPDYIELPGMHTLAELCVPIQHEGQLLGVINIESDEPGVFDHTDLEVVQTIADGLAVALQNARLLAEVRRASAELEQKVEARTRDLNAVHETLLDITTQLDLPQVLRAIAERAAHLVSAKSSAIYLLDAEHDKMEIVVSYGLERDYTGWRLALGEGLAGRVAASGQPLVVDDYQHWEGRAASFAGEPITAVVGVPLTWQGQVIGVLNVMDDIERRSFTQDDVHRLMLLAPQAAIAIVNARLYQEERRARAVAEALRELAEVVNSSLDLPEVLQAIVARAAAVLGVNRVALLLLDAERGVLRGAAAVHPPELEHLWRLWQQLEIPIVDRAGIAPAVAGEMVASPNAGTDPQTWLPAELPQLRSLLAPILAGVVLVYPDTAAYPQISSFAELFHVRSILMAPLISEGQFLGLLTFDQGGELHHFSVQDISLARAIAQQAAIAVRNAQLYQEVRRASAELEQKVEARTRDLNAVHETLLDITAQLDLPQVLRAIAERAAHLVSAKASLIDLLDRERNELECATCYGFERDYSGWRQRADEGLSGRVAASGQPLVVDDYQHWEGRAASFAGEPITAVVGVPLTWQDQVIGVLNVMDDIERRSFTQDDVHRLMLLAPQAAIAIANARLYADAQAKAERLRVLRALDRAIASGGLDIHGLFNTFAEQAARLLGYDRMSLALLEGDQIHILAVEAGLAGSAAPEMWLPRQGTGTYWAIEHNQMLQRLDITQEPHYREDEFLIPAGIRTAIVVPLRAHGQVLGTWNLGRREPRPYSPAEIEILQTIADQLAIALDHARLHEELIEGAARLRQAYAELEEADRLKDQMIQNISHELRLPLTLVKGYLDLALDGAMGEVPAALAEALKTVSGRANDIVAIVERITTLHSLRLGGLELERLSLSGLVRQAADLRCQSAKRAGLKLELDLPEEALEVQGNAERLLQVLDNLLDNAVKFTPPGGHIRLRARGGDGMVIVEISDTGIGIPADKLDRIWDRFYQVDGSTTRHYSGVGVGLALVKDVIEAHGGTVWVHSREGQGSTFGFALRQVT